MKLYENSFIPSATKISDAFDTNGKILTIARFAACVLKLVYKDCCHIYFIECYRQILLIGTFFPLYFINFVFISMILNRKNKAIIIFQISLCVYSVHFCCVNKIFRYILPHFYVYVFRK